MRSPLLPILTAVVLTGCADPVSRAPDPEDPGVDDDEVVVRETYGPRLDTTRRELPWPVSDTDTDTDTDTDEEVVEDEPNDIVLTDEVMVRAADAAALAALAAEFDTVVVLAADSTGLGSLRVPDGMLRNDFLDALLAAPTVRSAGAIGRMSATSAQAAQWHLASAGAVDEIADPPSSLPKVVVAVLDTGVAYEDYADESGQRHARAASLASSTIVAPWDFVNDDAHPNDDHQHGTHIASLIASSGSVSGVAPGVGLMPLKVLDEDKQGHELHLIRALRHAIAHEANVVNMSLAFHEAYVPSPELREALQDAHEAGIILVAAAGNDGAYETAWPAASPHVIAVGATDYLGQRAWYSNQSPRVDVSAPGGVLSADRNGDGYPDGMLAETILPGDPSATGLYFMEGTSQATALVSGAAAMVIADGEDRPARIRQRLMNPVQALWDRTLGQGSGPLDITEALASGLHEPDPVLVSMIPYVADRGDGKVAPGVWVRAVDEDGRPFDDVQVYGTIEGSSGSFFRCLTGQSGTPGVCRIEAAELASDPDGLAWRVSIDNVRLRGLFDAPPESVVFASDAMELVQHALDASDEARGRVPVLYGPAGSHPRIKRVMVESYLFPDLGAGRGAYPEALIATAPAIDPHLDTEVVSLSLDGTGLLSSPMGFMSPSFGSLISPSRTSLGSGGLLGLSTIGSSARVAIFDPEDPVLPISSEILFEPDAAPEVPVIEPRFEDTSAIVLGSGVWAGRGDVEGSALEGRLLDGGWTADGYDGVGVLVGIGVTAVHQLTVRGSSTLGAPVRFEE